MKTLNKKDMMYSGLMLFALFFGAGSLIFPPMIGQEAGASFLPAIIGFVLTCVGLPLLGIISVALNAGNISEVTSRIHPMFTLGFMITLYLAIGPFFAIPRAMNVSYEMGLVPFLEEPSSLSLLLYSVVFFVLCYLFVIVPSKLVESVGQWITPFLLLTILMLVVGFVGMNFSAEPSLASESYSTFPFFRGFVDGYLMMDAIASLAFGTFVIAMFKSRGIIDQKHLLKGTIYSGIIAAIFLVFVYIGIGYIGVITATSTTFENGGELLTYAANATYGTMGTVLLGTIVTLACLTTCIGLISACGQYFNSIFPKLSYQTIVILTIVVSFAISNFGLTTIINISLPVLYVIYPITFLVISFSFLHKVVRIRRGTYIGTFVGAFIVCIYDGLVVVGVDWVWLTRIFSYLPLLDIQMAWILPALIGGIIGHFIPVKDLQLDEGVPRIPSV
ncbi:branched-chain amino acid transport system II carrier protein [Peribacillus sp. NPDC060186]